MSIATNIKRLREIFDLTQADLAEVAGVTKNAVSQWENGRAEPRMGAIERMAACYGITKSHIIEDGGMPVVPSSATVPLLTIGRVHAGAIPDSPEGIIYEKLLEGAIVGALRELLSDREEALRIAHMVADRADGAEIAARRKQAAESLSAAERGLKNILNAIEQGIIAPGAKERIAELEHQRDRAKLDLEAIRDDQIDPERLADFLQCGSALDDATLLKAFVYQVSVSDEECIVTLNYDVESNEPARLDVQRVRTKCKWYPGGGAADPERAASNSCGALSPTTSWAS